MTPAQAETLAVKICQTWTRVPPVDVWVEDLLDLDEGAAGTALMRLRREAEHAPTIAKFRATVRSLHTTDGGTPRPEVCKACDDTGWVQAPDHIEDDGLHLENGVEVRHTRTYSQVKPCVCREGRQREQSAVWTAHHPPRRHVASREVPRHPTDARTVARPEPHPAPDGRRDRGDH